MWVLGINAFNGDPWHDSAACLVDERGQIYAFGEEERFSRVRHAVAQTPERAARFCLETAGIRPEDIDVVAVGWDVPRMFTRMALKGQRSAPWKLSDRTSTLQTWLGWTVPSHRAPDVVFVPHHTAHALCGLYTSPFDQAAVVVADGVGEDESISIFMAERGRHPIRRRVWPKSHSLGCLYEATGHVLGLGPRQAGKTMGLASYGRYKPVPPWKLFNVGDSDFEPVLQFSETTTFHQALAQWVSSFSQLARTPIRRDLGTLDSDASAVQIAWSTQAAVEEVMTMLAAYARRLTGIDELCISGGVGLNCSANGQIPEPLYVPPVPDDAGVALGAAWYVSPPAAPVGPLNPFLGKPITSDLSNGISASARINRLPLKYDEVVDLLIDGRVGAIAEGRAEIGPRALCHRSIIALPRPADMRQRLNRIKGREQWRPFGPVSSDRFARSLWPSRPNLTRYMLGAVPVSEVGMEILPAATHSDGTTRPQEVMEDEVSTISELLKGLSAAGLPPVLINTSFNGPGQPIVNTTEEALAAFNTLDIDFMLLDDSLLIKS